ncbi:hypothetical protein [Rhodopila globiformis]|uniref:hypothetical protein n=1 Tax=Rhodopila globiformis TaxID=1071 RepID=UPI001304CC18|nr:hypothetical protein [Rhodopila globiformis]
MSRLFRASVLLILAAASLAGCAAFDSEDLSPPQNAAPGQHLLPNGLTPEHWDETS